MQPGAQPQQPEPPLTRAELNQLLDERDRRNRQSVGDQLDARVQRMMAQLQSAGIQATPQQVQAMIDSQPQQGQPQQPSAAQAASPNGPSGTAQPGGGEPQPHPAIQRLSQLMQGLGVQVDEQSTPDEWKQLADLELAHRNDPEGFAEAAKPIILAIYQQMQSAKQKAGSPARTPGAIGGGSHSGQPAHAGKSGLETLNQYFENWTPPTKR
jgi:hypothetical protein